MKLKGMMFMLAITLSLFGLCACGDEKAVKNTDADTTVAAAAYVQISGEEAKHIMDTEVGYIIIDARTQAEFDEGHIGNAILIPEYEITDRAEAEIPEKDTLILVYCRSGRRSKIAADALAQLGYTNVKEFGGIIDWQYEIVK